MFCFKLPIIVTALLLSFTAQQLSSNEYGIGPDGTGYVKGYEPSNNLSQEPDYALPPDYDYFIGPNANLEYADFTSVDLSDANLTGAILNNANLQNTNLNRATLENALLRNADLAGTRFNEANLRGANLDGSSIWVTVFTDADMTGAIITNANLQAANFTSAVLRRVNFSGSNLNLPFFLVTDLSGANFSNADLSNAQLDGTIWDNVRSLDEYEQVIAERDAAIAERDARPTHAEYYQIVAERDAAIAEKDARPTQVAYEQVIAERDSRLSHEEVTDLRLGSSLISVDNGFANLTINFEESIDLENWHVGSTTNFEIPVQDNEPTKFFRVVAASVSTGDTGDSGDTGDTGDTGDSGDTGDTGEAGDTDDDGLDDNTDAFPDDVVTDNLSFRENPSGGLIITDCKTTAIGRVNIPSNVTEIAAYAFDGCNLITQVVFPEGLTTVRDLAFRDCTALQSVYIADSVVYFENAIFRGCTSLSDVRLSNNMTTITDTMFQMTGITTIEIPSSVTKIDRVAFDLCESLTSIVIPSSVTTFGETVFNRCANLKEITFEGNAPEIVPAGIASHWANTSNQPKLLNIGYNAHQMFPNLYLPDDFIIKYYSSNSGFTEEWFNSVLRNYNSSKSLDIGSPQ